MIVGSDSVNFYSQIVQGENALKFLENEDFQEQWAILQNQCKHSSVFQGPSFVMPWYRNSLKEFSPLLLASFENDRLVGLITLARKIKSPDGQLCKRLVGAGDHFALYQTWLILPGFEKYFWENGIKLLLKQIPGAFINLKSLPDHGVYDAFSSFSSFKTHTVLEKFINPVLDFKADGYDKIFGKRHFKSKLNRLSRAGEVKFEKIISASKLEKIIPEIEGFYGIRQGAAFNKSPYSKTHNDRSLFLDWFASRTLHATGLWLDEELIGAIIMIDDKGDIAHLAGLITYSPWHAKLSPGLVHLYLVAQLLKEEAFNSMKLSPGYDAYKDRFSNRQEEIFELLISLGRFQLVKRKVRVLLRNILLRKGVRPMEADAWVSKSSSNLKNKISQIFNIKKEVGYLNIEIIKKLEENFSNNSEIIFSFDPDSVESLLLVDDYSFSIPRWEFLDDCLGRLEENENFMTCVKNEKLIACIWYSGEANRPLDLELILESEKIHKVYFSNDFKLGN